MGLPTRLPISAKLLLFFLLLVFAHAGILRLHSTLMRPGRVIYERVALFSQKDTPWGRQNASISYSYTLHVSKPDQILRLQTLSGIDDIVGEFLVVHSSLLHGVGLGHSLLEKKLYCCTDKLSQEKLCSRPNRLILDESLLSSPLLFYAAVEAPLFKNLSTTVAEAQIGYTASIHTGGVYYLFLSNCRVDPSISFTLDGSSIWRNPFGYLNGEEWAELPLYWVLSVAYVILIIFYGTRSALNRPHMRALHIAVLSLIGIAVLHSLTAASGHSHYNETGEESEALLVLSALLSALLECGVRIVILMLALGFSIPRHQQTLTRSLKFSLAATALLYAISAAASDYFVYLELTGTPVDELSKLLVDGALVITNLVFFIWIGVRLVKILNKLRDEHNGREYGKFLRLSIALAGALSISIALFFAQTYSETSSKENCSLIVASYMEFNNLEDAAYKYWWMWEAYWEIVNAGAISYISLAWQPSPARDFAYSRQLEGDDSGLDSGSDDNAELVSLALQEEDQIDLDDDD